MSNRNSRHPTSNTPSTPQPSKLPKFLQKQANRDRSKSVTDPSRSVTSLASGSSASISLDTSSTPSASKQPRKSSKFLSINRDKEEKSRRSFDAPPTSEMGAVNSEMEEPPVIIEPVNIPRSRPRSDRPLGISTSEPAQHLSLYTSSSSTSGLSNLPTRLSGWFSHTFSTSSTDLSLPAILSQTTSASPKGKNALLTAAKHGKGHLDKAMRYLLDSDSTPDRCVESIWLLGVQHPGYEPPPPSASPGAPANSLSSSTSSRRNSGSFRSSVSSVSHLSTSSTAEQLSLSHSQSSVIPTPSSKHANPAANWPPAFYADFTSRLWLTYRSNFMPIRDTRLADLPQDANDVPSSPTTVKTRPWNWGAEKGWTSDSGWGCMLRTGQSLLANALIHLHLGREWRRPPYSIHTADYATYVQILTWFFDSPSPEAPFSVHRMALAGKELGKDVGQWFGPSTAAGAIKTLLAGYPEAGLGVSVATDGVLFQTDVFAASNGRGISRSPKRHVGVVWGDRPVLLLIGVRLGIDGVNPIYYETIKRLYTFPQSVGIAGGRPSSSYYFVGSQADNLFYLDPHHARPAIPLRPVPQDPQDPTSCASDRETTPESDHARHSPTSASQHYRSQTSPSSVRTGSSTFSYHAPLSPSPLQKEFSTSSTNSSSSNNHQSSRSPPPSQQYHHPRWQSSSQPGSPTSEMDYRELSGFGTLDPVQEHYVNAYHAAELKTFHCERVRKMPLSGLDPSMLIGFLCKDEADWRDFRRRVGELPRTVFSVQDEPPTWPSDLDDNMGLESLSEPDDLEVEGEQGDGIGDEDGEGEGEGEGERFFDTRSGSPSTSSAGASGSHHEAGRSERGNSEEVDTEDDPVDPITPGPNSRFLIDAPREGNMKQGDEAMNEGGEYVLEDEDEPSFEGGDIEDDWVDPSIPSPPGARPSAVPINDLPLPAVVRAAAVSTPVKRNGSAKKGKKGKKRGEVPVPVPIVRIPSRYPQEHLPFPVTVEEHPQDQVQDDSTRSMEKRMHTARARDGGRTQSGGVKGVITEN